MAGQKHEPQCLIVASRDDAWQQIYARTLEPAVRAAAYEPVRALAAGSARDRDRLRDQVRDADVVLVDARHPDQFCILGLGMAVEADRPVVVITRDELPVHLEAEQVIKFEDEPELDRDAHDKLEAKITERLAGVSEVAGDKPPDRLSAESFIPSPAGIAPSDAQALINAMWADGLTKQAIRNELLESGAPASWIDARLRRLRLARREGW